jgi:EAL domain-containing protein (putative c-di-GMP-specific phosphodiesterase class I)
LDLLVIIEGVEAAAQRSWLYTAGCRYVQGYLLGRPVPAADVA